MLKTGIRIEFPRKSSEEFNQFVKALFELSRKRDVAYMGISVSDRKKLVDITLTAQDGRLKQMQTISDLLRSFEKWEFVGPPCDNHPYAFMTHLMRTGRWMCAVPGCGAMANYVEYSLMSFQEFSHDLMVAKSKTCEHNSTCPAGAVTGRMSMMQPKSSRELDAEAMRDSIRCPPGRTFMNIDYSGLEMMIMAQYATALMVHDEIIMDMPKVSVKKIAEIWDNIFLDIPTVIPKVSVESGPTWEQIAEYQAKRFPEITDREARQATKPMNFVLDGPGYGGKIDYNKPNQVGQLPRDSLEVRNLRKELKDAEDNLGTLVILLAERHKELIEIQKQRHGLQETVSHLDKATAGHKDLVKISDEFYRFVCGMNFQDHPRAEQRQLLDLMNKLRDALLVAGAGKPESKNPARGT